MSQENTSADDAARLQYINAEAAKYFEAMKAAKASGADLANFIDPAGMDALKKITALADEADPSAPKAAFMPHVADARGGPPSDLFSLLLKKRVVLLEGPVDDAMAAIATASIRYLNSELSANQNAEIVVRINSPGGSVIAGLAIYDAMRTCTAPITTVGIGMQASMGSVLLAAGDKRIMTQTSWLMIHQIASGAQGQHSDTAIAENFTARLHEQLKDIYVRHIGLTHEFWDLALERNTWLTAEQAKKMGFIHEIFNDAKPTAYEKESLRTEFQKARDGKIPTSVKGILKVLNNVSAREGEAAKIRPELVTALSQFPEFWTEAKKQEMKRTVIANDNQDIPAPNKKISGPPGPS